MAPFFDLSFWLYLLIFLFASFFAFYIPGSISLKKLHLSSFSHIVLSLVVGMVLWGWQGFIFGLLGIRWMTYLYLFICFVLWIKTADKQRAFALFEASKKKGIYPRFTISFFACYFRFSYADWKHFLHRCFIKWRPRLLLLITRCFLSYCPNKPTC